MDKQQMIRIWLQQLNSLQDENAKLKTKLAYKVQSVSNPEVLDQAEYFQTQFLNKDVAISLLRHELSVNAGNALKLTGNGYTAEETGPEDMGMSIKAMEEDQFKLKAAFEIFLGALSV